MNFDVFDRPWIPIVDGAGRHRDVGLHEAFARAHELRWIDAEAPVVTAALHRLLLAFAHRIYGPESRQAWEALWTAEGLPEDELASYRDTYRDRFDLFDQQRPFLQCPALPQEKMGSAAQLVLGRSVGNNATLFDRTTAQDHPELDPAEAARWLVTLHAFDTGGLKTPYTTDKSAERGLCNFFGVTLVEAATLKETLLLNLHEYSPHRQIPDHTGSSDGPPWEHAEPPRPEPDKEGRPPRGVVDLLTWPSRRILLRPVQRGDAVVVDGAVITPGERFRSELANTELMGAFFDATPRSRRSLPQPTKPVTLEELRGVWRHCRELLLPAGQQNRRQRPRVLDHVAENAPDEVYTLRVFGQRLDRNGGAVEAWMQESVPAPVSLLRVRDEQSVEELLGQAVRLADYVGSALEQLDKQYDKQMSAEHKNKRSMLTQWYWPELSEPFGKLLRDVGGVLDAQGSRASARRELIELFTGWRDQVRNLAWKAATTWAERSPRGSGRQVMSLADAENSFKRAVSHRCREYDERIDATAIVDDEED